MFYKKCHNTLFLLFFWGELFEKFCVGLLSKRVKKKKKAFKTAFHANFQRVENEIHGSWVSGRSYVSFQPEFSPADCSTFRPHSIFTHQQKHLLTVNRCLQKVIFLYDCLISFHADWSFHADICFFPWTFSSLFFSFLLNWFSCSISTRAPCVTGIQ